MGGVEGIAVMVDDVTMPEEIYKVHIFRMVCSKIFPNLSKRLVWS